MFEVQIRRAAEVEMAEARRWYEAQQVDLGAEFLLMVAQVIDRLAKTPLIYPLAYQDFRRALIKRFPYLLWYRVKGSVVIVVACTHAKRDPEQQKSKLK